MLNLINGYIQLQHLGLGGTKFSELEHSETFKQRESYIVTMEIAISVAG